MIRSGGLTSIYNILFTKLIQISKKQIYSFIGYNKNDDWLHDYYPNQMSFSCTLTIYTFIIRNPAWTKCRYHSFNGIIVVKFKWHITCVSSDLFFLYQFLKQAFLVPKDQFCDLWLLSENCINKNIIIWNKYNNCTCTVTI